MVEARNVVYIVDDDASVRKGVTRLIRSAGYDVEAYASGLEFLEGCACDRPGCVVLDICMPGLNGLELQERMAAAGCPIPVIFITGHGDIPMSVRAMKRGAVDFLSKPFHDETLLAAIGTALEKDRSARELRQRMQEVVRCERTLTARERDVFRWVTAGLLNKQIADKLGISEKTVKVHRGRVMQKMRAESVADLVRLAQQIS
jgi:RNA polymerase sigma factor (sigma-70 family)